MTEALALFIVTIVSILLSVGIFVCVPLLTNYFFWLFEFDTRAEFDLTLNNIRYGYVRLLILAGVFATVGLITWTIIEAFKVVLL